MGSSSWGIDVRERRHPPEGNYIAEHVEYWKEPRIMEVVCFPLFSFVSLHVIRGFKIGVFLYVKGNGST